VKRARLIANPNSGMDRVPDALPVIAGRLRTIVRDLDITVTMSEDDAERGAAQAVDERCDALYVAGGDGTLNAVLRGLAARSAMHTLPIGVIPFGTGNDFVKALDLGDEPVAALDHLLALRVIDVDVGTLNDRPFVNTSAGGFVADVSEQVTETLKDAIGKLAYLIGGTRALLGTVPFSVRLTLNEGGGGPARAADGAFDAQMFVVSNGRYIGGGYAIAPAAFIDDGLLDVIVVPRMSTIDFVAVLQRLGGGADAGHPDVLQFRASSFDLAFDRPVNVNVDGELREADHCHYRVRRAGAQFFCGPHPHATQRPRALPAASG
jgi:diacylglycerol kinase (ATP)